MLFGFSMERESMLTKRFSMSFMVTASFLSFLVDSFTISDIFLDGTEVLPFRQNSKSGMEQNRSVLSPTLSSTGFEKNLFNMVFSA
jgi:hypothetical protein